MASFGLIALVWKWLLPYNWNVPIPVWLSIMAMATGFLGVYMAAHPPAQEEKKKKLFYKISFLILSTVIVAMTWRQSYTDNREKIQNGIVFSNQMSGVQFQLRQENTNNEDLKFEVRSLKDEISTNAGIADSLRLTVLGDQYDKIVEENQNLETRHELLDTAPVDLNTIREEHENELMQKTNNEKLTEIQTRIDELNDKKRAESDAMAEKLSEEKANQDILAKEREMTSLVAPIFDYIIVRFSDVLSRLKDETGQNIFGDFNGLAPSLSSSRLINQNILVEATNDIAIGTNAAWDFQITSSIDRNGSSHHMFTSYYTLPWTDVAINIIANMTNATSILTIKPVFISRYGTREMQSFFNFKHINGDIWVSDVTLTLSSADGINIGPKNISYENYTNEIDEALESLIGSQDDIFKLKPK